MHGENPEGREAGRVWGLRTAQRQACVSNNRSRFVPTAHFAVLNGTNYNGIYHYNGRADTYYYIGQALGRAMIELLSGNEELALVSMNKSESATVSTF